MELGCGSSLGGAGDVRSRVETFEKQRILKELELYIGIFEFKDLAY